MGKKKKEDEQAPGAPMWMATFGDLMSLLLTFFVLLLSFSTMNVEDFNEAMGSLQGALGVMTEAFERIQLVSRDFRRPVSSHYRFIRKGTISTYKVNEDVSLVFKSQDMRNELTDFQESITRYLDSHGMADSVTVDYNEKGVKIRIPGHILFDSAGAEIKRDQKTTDFLQKLVELLKQVQYGISIEGHTDNRIIENEDYDSNWNLSSDRAISVLNYFNQGGIRAERMFAVAKAEHEPFMDNETLRGRKMNRRVEVNLDVSRKFAN